MKTLAIIKPDAVENNAAGFILFTAQIAGFKIRDMVFDHLGPAVWTEFYMEHVGKPFFEKLVKFMASGPCVLVVLEKDGDAVGEWRMLMKRIREIEASKEYSERNAVHGSDSEASARRELELFFPNEVDSPLDTCLDCGNPDPHLCPASEVPSE